MRGKTMKNLIQTGLLIALFMPTTAAAQSAFDGTWKVDIDNAQFPTKPYVYVLQDGTYKCSSCVPPIEVKADGHDHMVTGHVYYDAVSIKVINDRSIVETDKKSGKTVTTETTTVSADGKTMKVEFSDSSQTNARPVTGTAITTRVEAGPAGSHAISGSWKMSKMENVSENAAMITFKVEAGALHMSNPTGQSYDAKLDGTDAPFKGDPGLTSVSVKQIDKNTIEETDKRDGKVIGLQRFEITPDGKTIHITVHDMLQNTTTTVSAAKQ
jgi:hypothetical protein